MDIGEILSKAWQIIWKYKVLWIFGILAGCGRGGSSSGGQGSGYQFSGDETPPPGWQWNFDEFSLQAALIIGAIILVVLLLIVLVIVVSTIGRIGLVRGVQQVDQQGVEKLGLGELFRSSGPFFWRVFGLNLLIGLVILVVVGSLALIAVLFSAVTLGVGALCLIPIICLLIPVGWFVQIIVEAANTALVVEDIGITAALSKGWDVVRLNIGNFIVMGLILGFGGALVSFLVVLPFGLVVIPALIGMAVGDGGGPAVGIGVSILCGVVYLPILIVLFGMIQSYISSAWTLTYLRATGRKAFEAVQVVTPAA